MFINFPIFIGKLFANCKVVKINDKVKDKNVGKKLWSVSAQLCGFQCDEPLEDEEEVKPEAAKEAKAEEKSPQ